MPPVVSIVGEAKTGKTTLVEKLLRELKARGYRVATIKHTPEGTSFDKPEKDSWRHAQAGSDTVAISSSSEIVIIKPLAEAPGLSDVIRLLGEDYDIIIVEGFKNEDIPKIAVCRSGTGLPTTPMSKLIAVATDKPVDSKTRQFSLEDVKGLVDLLEKGFIQPHEDRISLHVNDDEIILTSFPREIIANILLAMASSLKGVGEIKKLNFFMKRKP